MSHFSARHWAFTNCLLGVQAADCGAKRIRVHTLTDGRDVEDGTSVKFLRQLEADLAALRDKGVDAKVASGGGRMKVTMDRYEVHSLFSLDVFMWNGLKLGFPVDRVKV